MVTVEVRDGKRNFRPAESVEVTVKWLLAVPPDKLETRLFWYTAGKGTQDVEVVESRPAMEPGFEGQQTFTFRAPEAPYSFSGKLISLIWAVEAVTEPLGDSARAEITISPTGEEVLLRT